MTQIPPKPSPQDRSESNGFGSYSQPTSFSLNSDSQDTESLLEEDELNEENELNEEIASATSSFDTLKQKFWSWFTSVPIRRKQLGTIVAAQLFSVLSMLAVGSYLLAQSGKEQLVKQASAEARIAEKEYIREGSKDNVIEDVFSSFDSGYGAFYRYNSQNKQFTLIDSFLAMPNSTKIEKNIPLPDNQILQAAIESDGQVVDAHMDIKDETYGEYRVTAKVVEGSGNNAMIIVRGKSEDSFRKLFWDSFLYQVAVAGGTVLASLLLARLLKVAIADRIDRLKAATQSFSAGNWQARAAITGNDEIDRLAFTFNEMAEAIDSNQRELLQRVVLSEQTKDLTLSIIAAEGYQSIINTAAIKTRIALNADRVIFYRFNRHWVGTVEAESLQGNYPTCLGKTIEDPCFADKYVGKYLAGRINATENVYEAGLTDCHLGQLEPFGVIANLVAPVKIDEELVGLLIAHQCSGPRKWSDTDIDSIAQASAQLSFALDRDLFLAEQKTAQQKEKEAKELLQKRALELLLEVDPVSRGDLTIRAKVKEDEIGTIADSYNATIESLRKIVIQVQKASQEVAKTTNSSQIDVRELSNGALQQKEEIGLALEKIQAMANSISQVTINAEAAEDAVQIAAETVRAGDTMMNRTVEGFLTIRQTVAETAKKVKRLGESTQKISKVVNLIGNFADQTNLLALNASIEAAHAGEEGRGFAVVAEEVRTLARQSANATAEIENLVATIQAETNEVVSAMEAGTEQVVIGTQLVEETRQSLTQIAEVSSKIEQLVSSIARAAVEQSEDSEVVTQTIAQIANISTQTSEEANRVSRSFQELLSLAEDLQSSISKFKVS
jgi:methyl-accepting chemotaxis protein PixJ